MDPLSTASRLCFLKGVRGTSNPIQLQQCPGALPHRGQAGLMDSREDCRFGLWACISPTRDPPSSFSRSFNHVSSRALVLGSSHLKGGRRTEQKVLSDHHHQARRELASAVPSTPRSHRRHLPIGFQGEKSSCQARQTPRLCLIATGFTDKKANR